MAWSRCRRLRPAATWDGSWSSPLSVGAHKAWFLLDLVIFYLVVKHAHKQTDLPLLKRYWTLICIFLAASSAVLYGTFVQQGLDVGSTIQSAYICQMPISFLYIPLLLRQKSLVGWSVWAGWARTLGTGLIGVFAFMRYPDHPFLLAMAVVSTLVDFIYMYLLYARKRELAQARTGLRLIRRCIFLHRKVRIDSEGEIMGRIVIAGYKPKAGMQEELRVLMREHRSTLRSQDLVAARESIMMEAKDGTIIEVFEWKSREAIEAAHSNPVVLRMWERYATVCDYIPVAQVEEAGQLFSEFTPLTFLKFGVITNQGGVDA